MCQFAIKLNKNRQNKRNLQFGQKIKITNLWNCMSRNVTSDDKGANVIYKVEQYLVIFCLDFSGRTVEGLDGVAGV